MAGDKSYVNIMDENDTIVYREIRYFGSRFSLEKYKYHDDSRNGNHPGKYLHLNQKSNGGESSESYGVLNSATIREIRSTAYLYLPITKDEEEACEDMNIFIQFIDEKSDLLRSDSKLNVVFHTEHDF